jgi:hypothetical protein
MNDADSSLDVLIARADEALYGQEAGPQPGLRGTAQRRREGRLSGSLCHRGPRWRERIPWNQGK